MKLGLPNRAPVGRWLLASLVVLSPLGFLLYESLADPEIRFLPPHPKAAWVLHPTQEVLAA